MAMNVEKYMAAFGIESTIYGGQPCPPYLGALPSLCNYRIRRTASGASIPLHKVNGVYVPAPPRNFHGINGYYPPPTALSRTDTLPADGSPRPLGLEPTLIVDDQSPSTALPGRMALTRVPTEIVDENGRPAAVVAHPSTHGGSIGTTEDKSASDVKPKIKVGKRAPLTKMHTYANINEIGAIKSKPQIGLRNALARVPTEIIDDMDVDSTNLATPTIEASTLVRVPTYVSDDEDMDVDNNDATSDVLGLVVNRPQSLPALTRGQKRRASFSEDLDVPHIPASSSESPSKKRKLDSDIQNDDEPEVPHIPKTREYYGLSPLGPYRYPMDSDRFRMSLKGQFFVRIVDAHHKRRVYEYDLDYVSPAPRPRLPRFAILEQKKKAEAAANAAREAHTLHKLKLADAASKLKQSAHRALELAGPRRYLLVREGFVENHEMPREERLVRWESGLVIPSLNELKARREERIGRMR